jgi:C4-dicarboxylate-specific signal transduction histidine kinase
MTRFESSKNNSALQVWIGGAALFALCCLIAAHDLGTIRDEAKARVAAELQNARLRMRSTVSVLTRDAQLLSSVETKNYAESMSALLPLHDGSIADTIVIYLQDGTIYADSSRPGYFGRPGELSPLVPGVVAATGSVDAFSERDGHLYLFALERASSLNETVGVFAVGYDLSAHLARHSAEQTLGLSNVVVSREPVERHSLGRLSFSNFEGLGMPPHWEIRADVTAWRRTLFTAVALTVLAVCFYAAFAALWRHYRRARENLREEEVHRVNSDRLVALGQMSAGIAHEINSPLAVIQLSCQQLQMILAEHELPDELASEGARLCDRIDRTTRRIGGIVSGLRTFARDGAQDPLAQAKLRDIVRDTLEICATRLRHGSVELRMDIDHVEDSLNCRSVQISQVILNLVNNAYDAVENTDRPWIALDLRRGHQHLELWVTDSGRGIPEHLRTKVWEPFYTTKPVGKGTGMGLSIARGILESHGGTLTIDADCPYTRFVVRLPV